MLVTKTFHLLLKFMRKMHLASFPQLSMVECIISYEPGTLNKEPGTLFALIIGKRLSLSLTRGSSQMRRFSYSVVSIVMSLGQNVKTGGSDPCLKI